MKTIIINWTSYKFKHYSPVKNWMDDIFDLYARPSQTKIEIFRDWSKKLSRIYGLTGNSMFFSIYWTVKDENWVEHDVWITPCNNYILN